MYHAPLREISFVLHELLDDQPLSELYADAGYSAEIADNILEEAAKFAENVLLPLNATGDREGARWSESGVTTPQGFPEAYKAYVEAGWSQLSMGQELGGQGMPQLINSAVEELMFASNMAFFLGTSLARRRGDCRLGQSGAAVADPAEARERRVDGDDEPHRAASRLGPGTVAHARGGRG
jgi:3-(methylthio)propanoyl-CoA dehydrogenase